MEFPILFQKIQSISEHFEFQIWNFQRLYFLQKTVSSTEGVRGKFLKWRPFKSVILTHDPFSRDKQAYKQRRFFAKDAAALNFYNRNVNPAHLSSQTPGHHFSNLPNLAPLQQSIFIFRSQRHGGSKRSKIFDFERAWLAEMVDKLLLGK